MARPKIDEAKKHHTLSISVRTDSLARAKASGNASRHFEQAADTVAAIGVLLGELQAGTATRADVLENIEDLVDVWLRIGEGATAAQKVLAYAAKRPKARKKKKKLSRSARGRAD